MVGGGGGGEEERDRDRERDIESIYTTLRASLSGTFLQTLPDLVTPLKGHSLSPRSCPATHIVQELCESRGGRPGLSVLTSLLVSVDVKIYCTVLRHWSQLVPNMSHDI